MGTTLKEFNAIREYIQNQIKGYVLEDDILMQRCTYEEWMAQYKPKREKVQNKQISEVVQKYFEEFWSTFPGTSKFTYNGKVFQGERVLKSNKQVCLKLYNDAINDLIENAQSKGVQVGQRCSTAILKALQVQLETIRIESYKSGQNRMQYMKSCEVYLRQRAYEPWIGQEMPESIESKEESTHNWG